MEDESVPTIPTRAKLSTINEVTESGPFSTFHTTRLDDENSDQEDSELDDDNLEVIEELSEEVAHLIRFGTEHIAQSLDKYCHKLVKKCKQPLSEEEITRLNQIKQDYIQGVTDLLENRVNAVVESDQIQQPLNDIHNSLKQLNHEPELMETLNPIFGQAYRDLKTVKEVADDALQRIDDKIVQQENLDKQHVDNAKKAFVNVQKRLEDVNRMDNCLIRDLIPE